MKLKEISAKTGPISDYLGYIILLFGWYFVMDAYLILLPQLSGTGMDPAVAWGLRLLVGPVIFAIVFGGIHERQEVPDVFERKGFFGNVKLHLLRLLGANLLSLFFYYLVSIIVFLIAGIDPQETNSTNLVFGIISVFFSTINLFWFLAVVVERKIFRGLACSLKTLLSNPAALVIGLIWVSLCFVDTFFFEMKSEQVPLATNLARSGVFAVARVLAVMYLLVIYKNIWGSFSRDVEGDEIPGGLAAAGPGEKLAKTSLGFAFVSFLPLLHLVALILGGLAIKRSQRLIWKAAIACWVGGFFTILYALVIAGLFAGPSNHFRMPSYAFLSEGNAALDPYVKLLDQQAVGEIQARLGSPSADNADRHWAFDCALALAKYNDHDLEGALQDFYAALQKKPERSEFYFYYGLALLDNEKEDMALEQFRMALEHEPGLEIAEKYIALVQNAYRPSNIESALMYILILIILFTLHEYGHAFAAWKLGDNTARFQGRLTLNPIVHLDIFGSILLPAVLLLQQADFVIGWAKPVPVNLANFKNPKRDHMLVSFAGPAVNLMVSMVCMVFLGLVALLVRVLWPETVSLNLAAPFSAVSLVGPQGAQWILIIVVFFKQLFYTSLILGFFNLIPIPPLDGSWILAGLLPQGLGVVFEKARQFSFVFFLLLMMTPVVNYILSIPIGLAWAGLKVLVSVVGLS